MELNVLRHISNCHLTTRELEGLKRTFKSKFKQQALEGDPKKARINFDDPNPKNLPGTNIIFDLKIIILFNSDSMKQT